MIVRIVLLIVVILAVLYLVDAYKQLRSAGTGGDAKIRGRRGSSPRPPADGELVRCASCGVHVPASRALRAGGGGRRAAYCSPACRRDAAAR